MPTKIPPVELSIASVPRHSLWSIPGRPCRAVIDLDLLNANYRHLRTLVPPDKPLFCVVKANAYGHGAIAITRSLQRAGATHFAVATVEEAIELRKTGITGVIMLLGPIDTSEIPTAISFDIEMTCADAATISEIASVAGRLNASTQIPVHLEIDTGMRRYGATLEESIVLAQQITHCNGLRLESVYTHFACSDRTSTESMSTQLALFDQCLKRMKDNGIEVRAVHAGNSDATLRGERFRRGGSRPGIALFGLSTPGLSDSTEALTPILTLVSRIKRVSSLTNASNVSYGWTYQSLPGERLGLIPIGYADGYQRILSNVAWMASGGSKLSVRGRVCMDQTIVGLPDGDTPGLGDEVRIAGDGSEGEPTFHQLASFANTIPYELIATLSRRIPRFYAREGQIVAIEDLSGFRSTENGI